jgi:hypothetical protein
MVHRYAALFLLLPVIMGAALVSGCANTIAKMSVDGMKPIMVDMREASNRNPDSELIREGMPAMLIQMDGFIMVSPENRYLLSSAAEANMGYAFLFVEDVDKNRARMQYLKARDYALRNLSLNGTFKKALEGDDNEAFVKALKTIHKRDIAPLYYATNAWLQWINVSHGDHPEVLKDLPRVEAMMDRILVLDDTFYHGGIHALMGVYNVSRPEMFGGQPEEANAHFKEAFEISQSKYLLWYFLYAKFYAVAVKDKGLFESSLNRIVSAPDDLDPQEAFVNSAVKGKARELLLHADDYFKGP